MQSSHSPYLAELDEAQRAAVLYNDGPALVVAGAGSGKTRVLVYKLLHLIHCGYAPYSLMALTFTNKAAREMRSRMLELVGRQAYSIKMGTFHSIFSRILREHATLLGYTPDFTIYDSNDSKARVRNIIKLLALDDKIYKPSLIASRISNAKNQLKTPEAYKGDPDLQEADRRANIPRTAEIYARYALELRQSNAMDFDDLLMQTNILFRDHREVLQLWQERIDYLLIDEYQDTNFAQYMIALQLMRDKGKIFVVGDDAQSIYSFRGANIRNILTFEKVFAGAKLFKLEQNYRSSQTIVEVARHLIAHNREQIHKEVYSLGEKGDKIELYKALSAEEEANWVASSIQSQRRQMGDEYKHFAVLYRTNQQSRLLEQRLRAMNIPFRIWGGRSFFDHKEIQDAVAYLRLMVNEQDDTALLRIINYPKRGIGDTTIGKLRDQALKHNTTISEVLKSPQSYGVDANKGTLAKLADFDALLSKMRDKCHEEADFYTLCEWLINTSGIPRELLLDNSPEGKGRRDNLQELLNSLDEYARNASEDGRDASLSEYLQEITLFTDQDKQEEQDDNRVTLMTIHASKGLEFPHIFITGLEEQLFPSMMSLEPHEMEEERRLFYVAITRAERTCHISYAGERFRNGRTEVARPSRFLRELPEHLLHQHSGLGSFGSGYGASRTPLGGGELPKHFKPEAYAPQASKRRVHIARRELIDGVAKPEVRHQSVGNLRIGSRVSHARFGQGEVLILEGKDKDVKATVRFDDGDEKKLLLRYANLQILD